MARHRLTLSISPELKHALDELNAATGVAAASFVGEIIEGNIPMILALAEAARKAKAEPAKTVPAPLRPKPRLGPLTKELGRIEAQLEQIAGDIAGIEIALADPMLYTGAADRERLTELLRQQTQARSAQERLEARWLELQSEIEAASS